MRNDYIDKGREEGLEKRYNKLISFLVRDKNYDAFERMTKDDAYKQELFKHFLSNDVLYSPRSSAIH